MKRHTVTDFPKNPQKAYVANGFIGFRFGKNPLIDSTGLLSGFSTRRLNEQFAVVPTPHITFQRGDDRMRTTVKSQTYDFSNGELTTEMTLSCGDKSYDLEYTVFASRTSPSILAAIITLNGDANDDIRMTVNYKIDSHAETIAETEYYSTYPGLYDTYYDGKCRLVSSDRTAEAGVAYRIFGVDFDDRYFGGEMITYAKIKADGKPIHILSSYVPGIMHTEPYDQAQRLLTLAAWTGVDRLREDNRLAWKELWESRIVIDCEDEKWQDAADASFFYLMSSASEFAPASVAPFGLSHPTAYDGHCFWDTESFMFMAPLFCAPEVAKAMLNYRFEKIDMAKHNAHLNGYRGIQFPWQSGSSGGEVTVSWCTSAGEQHVNFDVALAFDGYARVHDDPIFLKEVAWPVIHGVCEWIESRVKKTDRGYEILHITGIDESHDDVNNDSYSNMMAAKLLRAASEYSVKLGYGEMKKWLTIADNMVINFFEDGVVRQYDDAPHRDGYSSLMAYFPYGYTNGAESDKKTIECMVYEGDIISQCFYPMQSGYLGIFPAWLGDREFSLKTYEAGCLDFFCEPFFACTECSMKDPEDRKNPPAGTRTSFITGRGSFLSGLIMGLTKMCPWKCPLDAPIEDWFGEDITLPAGWNKITIGKISARGKNYRIEAENGAKRATITEI